MFLSSTLYKWHLTDAFKLKVKPGKTCLLRLISAALNDELLFSIASHTLTVVADDAVYVKPFDAPVMPARPYATGQGIFDNSTVAGFLEHEVSSKTLQTSYSVKKIKSLSIKQIYHLYFEKKKKIV